MNRILKRYHNGSRNSGDISICPRCMLKGVSFEVISTFGDYWFLRCNSCEKAYLIEEDKSDLSCVTFPNSRSEYYIHMKYIPDHIKSDFEEMLKTFDIQCYNSSVAMSRRTMQKIVRDALKKNGLEAKNSKDKKSKDLQIELETLKNEGVILKKTFESYQKAKKIGQFGVHPDDAEGKENCSHEDAEICIKCILLLIKEIYEQDEIYESLENNPKLKAST